MPKYPLLLILLYTLSFNSNAQNSNTASGNEPPKINISGYFQFQYQKASAAGISSFAGGDFPDNNDSRFIIRRGRFKVEREDKFSSLVLSVEANQDGLTLKDAFLQIKDPLFNTIVLTAGQFNRPFGYALSYSSSQREVPERPRFYQTMMPGERDLGVMLTIHPARFKFIQYDIALLNGSGANVRDYDSRKDLSTSLKFNFNGSKTFTAGLGISYYKGFVRQKTTTTYINESVAGKPGFAARTSAAIEGSYAKREYKGANLQLEHQGILGRISVKTEYMAGQQAGIAPSASVKGPQASRSFSTQPPTDIYVRDFDGFYLWLVKDIPGTPLEIAADYDFYDPNTFVRGTDIGIPGSNTTAADIRYKTLGAGLIWYMDPRLKLTAYYEHPVNEKTSLSGYTGDLNDNVFTARLQYRF